jgi:hypothetical protein
MIDDTVLVSDLDEQTLQANRVEESSAQRWPRRKEDVNRNCQCAWAGRKIASPGPNAAFNGQQKHIFQKTDIWKLPEYDPVMDHTSSNNKKTHCRQPITSTLDQ